MTDTLLSALRQKAERHVVYPLNRDECLALVDVAERYEAALWTICKPEYELRRDRVEIAREALDA